MSNFSCLNEVGITKTLTVKPATKSFRASDNASQSFYMNYCGMHNYLCIMHLLCKWKENYAVCFLTADALCILEIYSLLFDEIKDINQHKFSLWLFMTMPNSSLFLQKWINSIQLYTCSKSLIPFTFLNHETRGSQGDEAACPDFLKKNYSNITCHKARLTFVHKFLFKTFQTYSFQALT